MIEIDRRQFLAFGASSCVLGSLPSIEGPFMRACREGAQRRKMAWTAGVGLTPVGIVCYPT